MMKPIFRLPRFLASILLGLAACLAFADEIKTTDGKVYKDVMIIEETPEFVKFKHADGLAKIPRTKLQGEGTDGAPADAFDSAGRVIFIKGKAAEIKTRDGRTFFSKDLSEVSANQMKFVSDSGIFKVKFSELPPDTAKLLGWDADASAEQDSKDAETKLLNDEKRSKYLQAESILKTASFEGKIKPIVRVNAGWVCAVAERKIQTMAVAVGQSVNAMSREVSVVTKNVEVDVSGPADLGLVWGMSDTLVMQTGQQVVSSQLYMVGKYRYAENGVEDKEVPIFFTDRNAALAHLVKYGFGTVNNTDVAKGEGGRVVIQAWGSGFFISQDGYVVTNYHVVEGASTITVHSAGKRHDAKVVVIDQTADLALLKIEGTPAGYLDIKPDKDCSIGDQVFTMGFPRPDTQGVNAKFTDGTISSLTGLRDSKREFQISVPIQPGNSGGPLVDSDGAVVGVIVSTLNPRATMAEGSSLPQNVNFAIKSSLLLSLCEKGKVAIVPFAAPEGGKKPARKDNISKVEKAAVLIKTSGQR